MAASSAAALSIFIPSVERPRLLRRALDYYAALPYPVIVADGSRAACDIVRHERLCYLHLPGADPWTRLEAALEHVHTPYCVASPDDDFLLPEGLAAGIEVLEASAGCVSVQGIYAEYRIRDRRRIDVGLKYLPAYRHHLLAMGRPDNPVVRVEALLAHFVQYVWAMHRTDHLARIARLALGEGARASVALELIELLFSLVSTLRGEVRLLPVLYSLRDVTPSQVPADRKAWTFMLSRRPERRAAFGRLLDAVSSAATFDEADIGRYSSLAPAAADTRAWLAAVLEHWALRQAMPPATSQHPPPVSTEFSDPESGLSGSFESPRALGDVDATPDTVLPALRLVQRDFQQEERFDLRFAHARADGAPPAAAVPGGGLVRALARQLGVTR